nr:hypothetical protein [Tanacetum cinerariifolium]
MGGGGLNFPTSAVRISLGVVAVVVVIISSMVFGTCSLRGFVNSGLLIRRFACTTSSFNLESLHEILDGLSIPLLDIVDFHWIFDFTPPDGAWMEYVSGGVTLLSISSTKHKERPLRVSLRMKVSYWTIFMTMKRMGNT